MNKKYAGIIIGLACFAATLILVLTGHNQLLDYTFRDWVYHQRTDTLTLIFKGITFMCNPGTIIVMCVGILVLPKTRVHAGLPLSIGALSVTMVNKTIKRIVQRDRPDELWRLVEESSYSFPSGHAITSMFFYGLLIYITCKWVENPVVKVILIVFSAFMLVTIGPSRVYLGVHFPTDVIAGWSLGLVALCITILVLEYIEKRGKQNGIN